MYALFRTPFKQIDTGAHRSAERAKVVRAIELPIYFLDSRVVAIIIQANIMLITLYAAYRALVSALENSSDDKVAVQEIFDFS